MKSNTNFAKMICAILKKAKVTSWKDRPLLSSNAIEIKDSLKTSIDRTDSYVLSVRGYGPSTAFEDGFKRGYFQAKKESIRKIAFYLFYTICGISLICAIMIGHDLL